MTQAVKNLQDIVWDSKQEHAWEYRIHKPRKTLECLAGTASSQRDRHRSGNAQRNPFIFLVCFLPAFYSG